MFHKDRKFHILFLFRGLSAVLLMALLTSCAKTSFLQPKEPVTIRFMSIGGSAEYYDALIQEFNKKYPYITIELVDARGMMRPGGFFEDVDVFAISQFQYSFMLENNTIRDLNSLIAEDEEFDLNDFYPSTVNAFSTEGQRWAIPIGADVMVMHYNKDLFDRSNTPYPTAGWTWDDFQNRAISVSKLGNGTFGYAYYMMGNFGLLEPMTFIYQHGGRLFDDLESPTRMILNDPQTIEAMTWYGRLISASHVAPQPGERQQPYPETGIENGQFGMWMGWFSDERQSNWGMAPLPRNQNGTAMANVVGLAMNKETTNTEACWQWITFLSQKPLPGLIPARQALVESPEYEAAAGSDVAVTARATIGDIMMMRFSLEGQLYQTWGKAMSALNSALTAIRSGEDAQTVLDAAQAQSGF